MVEFGYGFGSVDGLPAGFGYVYRHTGYGNAYAIEHSVLWSSYGFYQPDGNGRSGTVYVFLEQRNDGRRCHGLDSWHIQCDGNGCQRLYGQRQRIDHSAGFGGILGLYGGYDCLSGRQHDGNGNGQRWGRTLHGHGYVHHVCGNL